MLQKERMIKTLTFQPVDRVPLVEWNIRESTMKEWIKQGYPEGVRYQSFFGLDTIYMPVPINMDMKPAFEEETIEQNERYKIWRDNAGAIRKDFTKNETPGFVTRQWLKYPVEDRADFIEMKNRYNSKDPQRYPQNWDIMIDITNKSHVPTHLSIPFLFWTVREWMGFENICYAFYDKTALLEEMFEFLMDFYIDILKDKIKEAKIDIVELKEDMAYKNAPMISPQMFKNFMMPHYVKFIDFLKNNGVKLVYVDCDGYPGGLIPLWIDAGVDAMSPCEIAAGNDLVALRREYPRFGLLGGIDKRNLSSDKKTIYDEVIPKVSYLIEKGGYIPHVDHAIPPDVPLRNYMYYREILTKVVHNEIVKQPD